MKNWDMHVMLSITETQMMYDLVGQVKRGAELSLITTWRRVGSGDLINPKLIVQVNWEGLAEDTLDLKLLTPEERIMHPWGGWGHRIWRGQLLTQTDPTQLTCPLCRRQSWMTLMKLTYRMSHRSKQINIFWRISEEREHWFATIE